MRVTSLAKLPRPAASRLAVRVTPDALRQIRGGHPWVYETSIESVKSGAQSGATGKPGDLAVVFDADRSFAAIGLLDPASPIRIKIIHEGKPATIDRAFWVAHITAALARRQPLIDQSLADLVVQELVDADEASEHAADREYFRSLVDKRRAGELPAT